MDGLMIVERGCGDPQAGGLYGWIPTSSRGVPPELFLVDYPQPIPDDLEIKARGLTMFEHEGIWHVADWVGENNYPNFPDWWEELCRFGFHQRIEKNLPFEKLDPLQSRYIVAHKRGLIRNAKQVIKLLDGAGHNDMLRYDGCPTEKHYHDWMVNAEPEGMCIGLLWQKIMKGEDVDGSPLRLRQMPSFQYYGFDVDVKVKFEPAFLASFPISMMRWLVYKGQDGEEQDTLEKLEDSPEWMKERLAVVDLEGA